MVENEFGEVSPAPAALLLERRISHLQSSTGEKAGSVCSQPHFSRQRWRGAGGWVAASWAADPGVRTVLPPCVPCWVGCRMAQLCLLSGTGKARCSLLRCALRPVCPAAAAAGWPPQGRSCHTATPTATRRPLRWRPLSAQVGVDDALVIETKEEIFELNNGCVCCTGKAACYCIWKFCICCLQFTAALRQPRKRVCLRLGLPHGETGC